jgi:hypothetical protein
LFEKDRVLALENDLAESKHFLVEQEAAHTASMDALYMDFEEKILACNGEIERVVMQSTDSNVRIIVLRMLYIYVCMF